MNDWQDTSNFSQRDTDRIPNEWRLRAGKFTLIVHRHIYYPGEWLTSCDGVFNNLSTRASNPVDARRYALVAFRDALNRALLDVADTRA